MSDAEKTRPDPILDTPKLAHGVFVALAAVGWADGKLDDDEADAIVRTALEEGLALEEIEAIEAATKAPVSFDDIDLGTLSKADRLFVYAVGTWITRVDGSVAEEEQEALDQLGELLRLPEKPRALAANLAAEIGAVSEGDKPAFYNLPMLRKTLKVRLAEAQALRAAQTEGED
ncbi:MAG: TerB family tellurite resistance protein [Myxococcales bacterium]|nr:TerB family tellurite resistance protein [Myxococcales bacterium]